MLGLYTKNGWRAGFAIAAAGALVGVASSAAVAAPVTKAEAQGVHATGAIVEILDTGDCITEEPVAYPGIGPRCGEGLETDTVSAFSQAVQGSATDPNELGGNAVSPVGLDPAGDVLLAWVRQRCADRHRRSQRDQPDGYFRRPRGCRHRHGAQPHCSPVLATWAKRSHR